MQECRNGGCSWRNTCPESDVTDANYVYAYSACVMLMQVLRQCNGDFSRENIMHQAESLHDFAVPTLLPGIKVNTRADRTPSHQVVPNAEI